MTFTNVKSQLKWILIGSLSLAILALLFLNSRTSQVTEHSRFVEFLRRLKEQDALSTQEVLELRFSLLTNYDPLVATSDRSQRQPTHWPRRRRFCTRRRKRVR